MRLPTLKVPVARYSTTTDDRGVVWRHDNHNLDAKPVKVSDPNYVPTWEKIEDDGTVTVQTGPYPTPKALDYVIYGSVAYVVLLVGVLIGAAA